MGCVGCTVTTKKETEPLIVDVNQMLIDFVWNKYKYKFNYFRRKCLRRKNFVIDVPENYFVFEQIEQSIKNPGRGMGPSTSDGKVGGNDLLKGKVPTHRPSNPEAMFLDSKFSNDTAQRQTYQFKFSKRRATRVEVSYQKGFTIGGKASFSIGVPTFAGEGSMKLEVTKSEGQSFEEDINMEAMSSIVVGPKSNHVVKVELVERKIHTQFSVRTRMSMPQGRAPIYIRRKSDDDVVLLVNVDNLKDIFFGNGAGVEKVEEGGKIVQNKIDFVTEGVIKGSIAGDLKFNLKSDETEQEKISAKLAQLQIANDAVGN